MGTRFAAGSEGRGTGEADGSLRFELLGPIRAWHGDDELDLGSPQQRAVLAILLLAEGRQVSMRFVVDAVWGGDPPRTAPGTVRTYISRIRRSFDPFTTARGGELLTSIGYGYAFQLDGAIVDVNLFTRHVEEGRLAKRRGDTESAGRLLGNALQLWRGVPLAGFQGPYADAQRTRLGELRMGAVEDQLGLNVESGDHPGAIAELRRLLAEHPMQERLSELLMLGLYRAGRRAEALSVFADSERLLREELGVDPGPALQRMHRRILRADRGLAPTDAEAVNTLPRSKPPAQLPQPDEQFTGRPEVLDAIVSALGRPTPPAVVTVSGMPGIGKTELADARWCACTEMDAAHPTRSAA
jgi:DNA-binding SARP family transcriptional activator